MASFPHQVYLPCWWENEILLSAYGATPAAVHPAGTFSSNEEMGSLWKVLRESFTIVCEEQYFLRGSQI